MGESTDQIKREIAVQRQDLGSNLNELESKAKSLTDWRGYFEKSPLTMIGVAFGGGLLLATMSGGRRRRSSSSVAEAGGTRVPSGAERTFDNIKGALFGLASGKAVEFLDSVVPGFGEHYGKQERQNPPSSVV